MNFAANKQVDNLYYGFFNFDLGTWKILLTAMISSSKIFWSWRTCFPQLGSEPTFFFYFYTYNYLWAFYWGWVEVKGQPMEVGFFFPSCSWGLISGCQSWQQVSLPTKLTCWPKEPTIFFPGQDTYFKFLLFILTESNHDLSFKFSSLPVLDGKEEKQHNLEKGYQNKKQQPLINIPWCCYVPHGYTRSNCLAISLVDAGFSWKADGGGVTFIIKLWFCLAGGPMPSAKGSCQVSTEQRFVSCFLHSYGSRQCDCFLYSLHVYLGVCILPPRLHLTVVCLSISVEYISFCSFILLSHRKTLSIYQGPILLNL